MRAAVFRAGDIVVGDIPEPRPAAGQVLVKTLSCGICGSDLHAAQHAPRMVEMSKRVSGRVAMDLSRDVVFGHEFCCEVLDYGPDTERRLRLGARAVAMPVMPLGGDQRTTVGYSNEYPGGYAERMVLAAPLLLEVPNGLPADHAALTEPLAVGIHAVEKAALARDDVPLVVGCGPVGLAAIVGLRLKGNRPIIAADFSPKRRELAARMGADSVIDPASEAPYAKLPVGRRAVIFECVGVPGLLQPFFGIVKELALQFVLGYTPEEFAWCLRLLAEGQVDGQALITGKVGLEGVKGAFAELANPERHTKILVEPWR